VNDLFDELVNEKNKKKEDKSCDGFEMDMFDKK